jgi:hypothetical protein
LALRAKPGMGGEFGIGDQRFVLTERLGADAPSD